MIGGQVLQHQLGHRSAGIGIGIKGSEEQATFNISYTTGQLVLGQWIKGSEEGATFKAMSGHLAAGSFFCSWQLKRRCEEAVEEECGLLKRGRRLVTW